MNRICRATVPLAAIALLGTAVVGCGSSSQSPEEVRDNIQRIESIVRASPIRLSLPVPIRIGDDGRVESIAGFSTSVIDSAAENLTGEPLIGRVVVVDQPHLEWFKRANIQHVSLASRPEGLFVLVNGEPMPYLAWDDASIDALVDTLGQFQRERGQGAYLVTPQVYQVLATALPLIRSLGVRLDVVFPKDEDVPEIPVAGDDAFDLALTEQELGATPLQTVDLEVAYKNLPNNQGWVPSFLGFSTLDLQTIGESFNRKVPEMRLRQDVRRRLESQGIETVGLETRADGMFVTVNGKLLPHVGWNEASLTNLSNLLGALYPEGTKLPQDAKWVPVARSTAPMLNDFALAVLLRFPVDGQAPATAAPPVSGTAAPAGATTSPPP